MAEQPFTKVLDHPLACGSLDSCMRHHYKVMQQLNPKPGGDESQKKTFRTPPGQQGAQPSPERLLSERMVDDGLHRPRGDHAERHFGQGQHGQ